MFDVADPEACSDAVAGVVARQGRLDVLVNNAGVMRRGDLLPLDRDDWDLVSPSTSTRCSTCAGRCCRP